MKILTLLLLVVSSTAFACPDLAGPYPHCKSKLNTSTKMYNMQISQKLKDGVTTYAMTATDKFSETEDTDIFVANEVAIDIQGKKYKSTITTRCTSTELIVTKHLSLPTRDDAGTLFTVVTKKAGKVYFEKSGNIMGSPVQDTLICE